MTTTKEQAAAERKLTALGKRRAAHAVKGDELNQQIAAAVAAADAARVPVNRMAVLLGISRQWLYDSKLLKR